MKNYKFLNKFDSLFVDQLFSVDHSGNTYVYPWAGFGFGYLVSGKKEQQIRLFQRLWSVVFFLSLLILSSIGLNIIIAPVSFLFIFIYLLVMYFLVKGLKRGNKRSIAQYYQDLAKKRSLALLVFLAIAMSASLVLIIWVCTFGGVKGIPIWPLVLVVLVFGVFLWAIVYMIYCKITKKK